MCVYGSVQVFSNKIQCYIAHIFFQYYLRLDTIAHTYNRYVYLIYTYISERFNEYIIWILVWFTRAFASEHRQRFQGEICLFSHKIYSNYNYAHSFFERDFKGNSFNSSINHQSFDLLDKPSKNWSPMYCQYPIQEHSFIFCVRINKFPLENATGVRQRKLGEPN